MVEKYCKHCGKPIPAPASKHISWQKYCSIECQKKAANTSKTEKKRQKRRVELARAEKSRTVGLDFCMNEADRLGISYGQYMARREQI